MLTFVTPSTIRSLTPLLLKLFALAIVVLILAVKYGAAWGFNV